MMGRGLRLEEVHARKEHRNADGWVIGVGPGPIMGPGPAFWAFFAGPLRDFGPGRTVEGDGGADGGSYLLRRW